MIDENVEEANFQLFRDCLSTPLIEKSSTTPPKKRVRKVRGAGRRKTAIPTPQDAGKDSNGPDDAEELAEFIDVWMLSFANRQSTIYKLLASPVYGHKVI